MQQTQKQIPSFLVIPLWGGCVGIKRQSKGLGALGLYRIMEACIYAVFPLWVLRICRIMRCSFVRWEALLIAFLCVGWVGLIPSPKKREFVFTISFSFQCLSRFFIGMKKKVHLPNGCKSFICSCKSVMSLIW